MRAGDAQSDPAAQRWNRTSPPVLFWHVGQAFCDTEAKMRNLPLGGVAALVCGFMTSGSNFARAEPPESLAYYVPKTPFIACDTREEIMQVVNSVKTNKLKETLAAFQNRAPPNTNPHVSMATLDPSCSARA